MTKKILPNAIDTAKYAANRVGQCVRPRTCSRDKSRERYYGMQRNVRFAALLNSPERFNSIPFFQR